MADDFDLKNMRRKKAREADRRRYLEGRYNRRTYIINGAFGQEPLKTYNLCCIGTSSPERMGRKSKEDLDSRSDYDS